MQYFSNTIQDLGIIELPLQGANYTWSRGENSIQASRIDRFFLISVEWNEYFKVANQMSLPKVISDHRPIIMERGHFDGKPSYFKLENMWLETEGFLDKVSD